MEMAACLFVADLLGVMRSRPGVCLLPILLLAGCQSAARSPLLPVVAPTSMASIEPFAPAAHDPAVVPARGESALQEVPRPARRVAADEGVVPASAAVLGPPTVAPIQAEAPANSAISSLTLSHALNRSLLTNPDLVALRGRLDVNQAMVGVAQTYPWNPFVQAQFFPQGRPFVPNTPGLPASGAGQSNYYVWVMQRFELAHQQQFRIQGALASLDQTRWTIFQGELLNVAQTMRLYFAALYQKEVHELAQETTELNERLAGIVERRFKANLAKKSDVTMAKVAARQSRQQAELADATYRAALLALYQQLNLPATAPAAFTEKLADVQWLALRASGPSADLPGELVEGRPDVLAAKAGARVADANFGLARAAIVPDIQGGPIYETSDAGVQFLGLRLQMNLPVFDTGRPLARQRQAELNLQHLTYEQLKIRATLEAQAACNQYERVRDLAVKATPVAPGAMPAELKEITSLFEAGQADILAVLTTQNNLLLERRIYLDLLNQLAQSAAAVVQATGLPPHHVVRLATSVGPAGNGALPATP
jgi:cobalt-zinc-cadmium efflux system outer membrane protein